MGADAPAHGKISAGQDFLVNTSRNSPGYLTEATRPAFNGIANVNAEVSNLDSEQSSYDALVRPIEDQMLRSIWRITRVAEDAEDALQESLVIIWKRRTRIERHPRPRALMLRICVNCACDVLRSRLRRGSRETPLADADALHAKDCLVAERLHREELREDIARALVQLPSRQATAVVMRDILELPYDEIGAALGCSAATVRVHVNRGHKKLSKLLAHLATY